MSEIHLSPELWRALLEGSLPPEEARALRAHLEEECERCDTILSEASLEAEGEVDALDGLADEALLGARESAWPADELAGARIDRAIRRRPGLWAGATAAVAAAALLFFSIGLLEGPGDGVRLKGGSELVLPRLELALVGPDGVLAPLAADAAVARVGHLLLRFDSPTEGLCGQLRVESGEATLLSRDPLCLTAGSSTFSEGGEVVAIALEDPSLGERVRVTFTLAGSTEARPEVRAELRLTGSE